MLMLLYLFIKDQNSECLKQRLKTKYYPDSKAFILFLKDNSFNK